MNSNAHRPIEKKKKKKKKRQTDVQISRQAGRWTNANLGKLPNYDAKHNKLCKEKITYPTQKAKHTNSECGAHDSQRQYAGCVVWGK